jgi:Uma2 family endonuclease
MTVGEELPPFQISLRLPAPLSDADLLSLSAQNEAITFEQTADGVLIMTPPTGSRGNRGEGLLLTELTNWNLRSGFGEIRGIAGGVRLPAGGQYQADVFVISAAAWAALLESQRDDGFLAVLPTAAFELISPANLSGTGYRKEFAMKLDDYARSKIPLVAILHPKDGQAIIRRPGRADEVSAAKILTFPELPGLELDAAAIYDACNRH